MSSDTLLNTIAEQIRPKIAKTSTMLAKPAVRSEIDEAIARNQRDRTGVRVRMSADELAKALVKDVIEPWPFEPAGFDAIQRILRPLKEISAVLDPNKLNEFVRVRDEPCVMTDRRMPIDDFKKALCKRLLSPPEHCEQ